MAENREIQLAAGPLLLLAGATATGKSAVALRLAEELNGEIVSADSMQVYRGLDIGTAKPSREEQRRVPHHLIDVVDVRERFDAAQFVRFANRAVAEIRGGGRLPILCGGTGLYFKALLEGLGNAPPADQVLRAELESAPLPELLAELERRDPRTFDNIDRKNPRRVIRAVEVIRVTGRPFSEQKAAWGGEGSSSSDTPGVQKNFFGLVRKSTDLHARINDRVDQMFSKGLVTETEQMLREGLAENPTAMQAIGYRQVVEYLRGERPLLDTIELVKLRTRQFAKRQMTWFRRQAAVTWIECAERDGEDQIAARIRERFESGS